MTTFRGKSVLVTGATGFIGGHLAHRLAARERAVVTGVGRHLEKAAELRAEGVELVRADVRDARFMRRLLRDKAYLFHAAAWMGHGPDSEAEELNVEAVGRLVRLAAAAGVRRLVHVSSIAVYGSPTRPVMDEDTPLDTRQDDVYGRTKARGEVRAREAAREEGVELTVVRPAMVYGPRSRTWTVKILRLVKEGKPILLGDGGGHCHPVFVENLVDGMLLAATSPAAPGETYNFSDPPVPWREYVGHYAAMCGVAPRSLPVWIGKLAAGFNDAFKLRLSLDRRRIAFLQNRSVYPTAKAERDLGYRPRVGLEEGMRRTEAWLREEGLIA
ncbi:MAG: NAD-dependent epimerase/dehydratase family protein [Gemmatimonadota bacterium]